MKRFTLLLTLLIPVFSFSQIINIPDDYPTIQEGINAAHISDTILVDTGTYYENINFKGKAITVASNYLINPDSIYINKTIIDGSNPPHPDTAAVVMFLTGEDTTSILCGFTITKGNGIPNLAYQSHCGGGIVGKESGAKIIHNIIIDNEVGGDEAFAGGGGIAFVFGSSSQWVVIRDNIIKFNQATATESAFGGGIYLVCNSSIEKNIIEYNSSICLTGSAEGGGIEFQDIYSLGLQLRLIKNHIQYNHIDGEIVRGGGITYLSGFSKTKFLYKTLSNKQHQLSEIRGNTISSNTMTASLYRWGGGIYLYKPITDFNLTNNEITDNSGTDAQYTYGGGIFMGYSEEYKVNINSNIVMSNLAEEGGGFFIQNAQNLSITNNLFLSNNASKWGGAIRLFQYNGKEIYSNKISQANGLTSSSNKISGRNNQLLILNNTFSDNSADEGGAIYVKTNPHTPKIYNSIFWENYAPPNKAKDLFIDASSTITVCNNDLDIIAIQGEWEGEDNIFENPNFVGSGDHPYQINDYSPCIDVGTTDITGLNLPEYDLAGEVRIVNDSVDMGAYEWNMMVRIEEASIPERSHLQVATYPNPFTISTTIEYELNQHETVRISFYNQFGKQVDLIEERQQKGLNKIAWTPENPADGIYYFRMQAGEQVASGKVVILN